MCLGNISRDFTINNMTNKKKQNRINRSFFLFSVFSGDFNLIDANDILDFQKYLMKRT